MSEQAHDVVKEVFKVLSGFSIEQTDNFLLIKIEKDELIKKMLTLSYIYERGIEYVIDNKYVVFKVPVQMLGEEALKEIGVK